MKLIQYNKIKNKKFFWEKFDPESIPENVESTVRKILYDIRKDGDKALLAYILRFDKVAIKKNLIAVTHQEFDQAKKVMPKDFYSVAERVSKNIKKYQKRMLLKSWKDKFDGSTLGSLVRPIKRVGIYVPGGTAPLVSTVFMSVIPALIAGVEEIVIATPPDKKNGLINPFILAACDYLGIRKVFKMGGAQAIGAMAFGTKSIPAVDMIVGPGNVYVASAKRQVFGFCGIDMVAGPSEILIIADDLQDPSLIAADLLSQAEHDIMARTFLVTLSKKHADAVKLELKKRLKKLSRSKTAQFCIDKRSYIFIVKNLTQAIEVANKIGPEHLELLCKNALAIVKKIKCAGAIFVGKNTPESVGDYIAGPSHVLPTNGTARFFSPLSAMTFQKTISYLEFSRVALKRAHHDISFIADLEGLDAHKKSLEARFEKIFSRTHL